MATTLTVDDDGGDDNDDDDDDDDEDDDKDDGDAVGLYTLRTKTNYYSNKTRSSCGTQPGSAINL